MAKDSFSMDPAVIAAVSNNLAKISKEAKTADEGVSKLESALHKLGKARAKASEKSILDPKESKEMLNKVKEIEKAIISLGVPMKQLLDIRKQEQLLYGKEVIQLKDLTKEGKKRVKEAERLEKHANKVVEINGHLQQIGANEVQTARKTAAAWGKRGWEASKYAAGLVGVSLSLSGIIALLIEAWDRSNRIGAMTRQINAQWAQGPTHLKSARAHILEIQSTFKMSYTEAGKYVTQLARAGVKQKDMNKLSKDLLAMQHLYGVEVGTSLGAIQGMAREYGTGKDEARDMLGGVLEMSKTIPDMSMDEILKDWGELSNKVKIYNTYLLGTIGLYNTLVRDEIADKLGLGDLPKSLRIELSKTIAGFSTEMGVGWQAALGKGETAAERIYEFRDLASKEDGSGLAEQFKRVAELVTEKTKDSAGDNRRWKMEVMIEQLGFKSGEMKQALSQAFTAEGGFSTEKFAQFAQEVANATKKAKEAQDKAKTAREALMKRGASIASDMVGVMARIRQKLDRLLLRLVELIKSINSFSDVMKHLPLPPGWKPVNWEEIGKDRELQERAAKIKEQDKLQPQLQGIDPEIVERAESKRSRIESPLEGLKDSAGRSDLLSSFSSTLKNRYGGEESRSAILALAELTAEQIKSLAEKTRQGDIATINKIWADVDAKIRKELPIRQAVKMSNSTFKEIAAAESPR